MKRNVDVSSYWRKAVGESKEFQKIADSENNQFSKVWEGYERIINNQFVDTCDIYGVEKWEKFLNIIPYDTDSLYERKVRIKTLLCGDLPYTWRSLEMKLSRIIGEDKFDMSYDKSLFLLKINIHLDVKDRLNGVKTLLYRIIPANIIFNVGLAYNKHSTLKEFNHSELAIYTHNQLKDEALTHNLEV